MQRRKNKSQSFIQYAILIAIVVGALIAMRVFIIRAVQEKYRQSADVFGQGEQYAKGVTTVTNLDGPMTDLLLPLPGPTRSCSFVVSRVAGLEKEIADLKVLADSLGKSGGDTEAILLALKEQSAAMTAEANQKEAQANDLRTQAAAKTVEADAKQTQIDKNKSDYPACFGYYYYEGAYCPDPDIAIATAKLEAEVSELRSQAASMRADATRLDAEAAEIRKELVPLDKTIAELEGLIYDVGGTVDLGKIVRDLRKQAEDKQKEIDQYKRDYPKCF